MTHTFGQRLRAATVSAESPDGTVRIRMTGDGGLQVHLADDTLVVHTEASLERQVNAALTALTARVGSAYEEAKRAAADDERAVERRVPGSGESL